MKISKVIVNPDSYLEIDQGRVWTVSRNKMAWNKAYNFFETSLKQNENNIAIYIVIGVQGSGKSTWIHSIKDKITTPVVFFDAALPAIKHRKKVLAIAQKYSSNITAVWIDVPLEIALERNNNRTIDTVIPEETVRSVYYQLQPPSIDEGFSDILVINQSVK